GVASGGSESGEVSGQHLWRGNKRSCACRSLPDGRALIARKEKQLVLLDRTAERAAELMAFQTIVLDGEEVARIERIVTYKFKDIAVKRIRAGLHDAVHGGSGMHSIGGILRARCQPKFLQCI